MTMSPRHFCSRLTTSGHLPQLCQRTDQPLVSFIWTLPSLSLNCRDLVLEIPIDQINVPQSKMHTSSHPTPINHFLDTLMPPTNSVQNHLRHDAEKSSDAPQEFGTWSRYW